MGVVVMKSRVLRKELSRLMPCNLKSVVASACLLALAPLLAISQQGVGQPPGGNPPPNGKAGQGVPLNGAQNPALTGTKDKTLAGKKPGQGVQTHPNGQPVEVGDPWDSLKLNPKIRIKLSFRNANIDNVIAKIQEASHVTIVKDPSLLGPVTVTTAEPVSLSEMFHVFNTMLKLKGFELQRDRKILLIAHPKPPPPPQMVMPMMGPPQPQVDPNKPVVKFYQLQFANANQVARAINEVFQAAPAQPNQPQFGMVFPGQQPQRPPGAGPSVHASYEEYSNLVIVSAPSEQQTEVEEMIKEIDKRQSEPQHAKTYKLTYATATEIAPTVQNILSANLGKGKGAKQENNNNFGFFFFGFNQNQNQNLAVADARTNSITVTGTDDLIAVADQVIADLDQKMPFTGTTFVFKLQNARADTVANLMSAAFGQRQGAQNNNNGNRPVTPTNNTFTSSTSASRTSASPMGLKKTDTETLDVPLQDPNSDSGDLKTSVGVSQFFGMFGQDGPNGRRNNTGITQGHDPEGRVIGVHDLTGQVTAIADPDINSVIIVTQPDNVGLIKDMLEQIDQLPEQVMIQTVIVEATLDKARQFGLEWQYATSKNGVTNTAGQTYGLQNAQPPLQGFSYSLTGGDLTAFFNMLQTDTKFQVLSTPRIYTSNNMEAQINISQSIPYIVSTYENSNGTISYNYSSTDVGIVLTVTPHITSNGYVSLDVDQTANDLQGYTTFNAPIVNQREAETTVSVKDGQTIILGGMIRNQVTSTVNKVPLLGDIPILGELFKSRSDDHNKTELLVFLTPRVVRDPAEARKLNEESQKEVIPGMQRDLKKEQKVQGGGAIGG